MKYQEKVSCLCVTEFRCKQLEFAYDLYRKQSYDNKQLIIVYSGLDKETENFVGKIMAIDTSVLAVRIAQPSQITLGEKRNIGVRAASGSYVCNWDDDDIYHVDRISTSLTALKQSGKKSATLSNIILYDKKSESAYVSKRRFWEQTIICNKNYLLENNISYGALNSGEDTEFVIKMADDIFPICEPALYIYVFHNSNTCNDHHFHSHFSCAEKLSAINSQVVANVVNGEITIEMASEFLNSEIFKAELCLAEKELGKFWGVSSFCHYPQVYSHKFGS